MLIRREEHPSQLIRLHSTDQTATSRTDQCITPLRCRRDDRSTGVRHHVSRGADATQNPEPAPRLARDRYTHRRLTAAGAQGRAGGSDNRADRPRHAAEKRSQAVTAPRSETRGADTPDRGRSTNPRPWPKRHQAPLCGPVRIEDASRKTLFPTTPIALLLSAASFSAQAQTTPHPRSASPTASARKSPSRIRTTPRRRRSR